jgi:hypothetical protein
MVHDRKAAEGALFGDLAVEVSVGPPGMEVDHQTRWVRHDQAPWVTARRAPELWLHPDGPRAATPVPAWAAHGSHPMMALRNYPLISSLGPISTWRTTGPVPRSSRRGSSSRPMLPCPRTCPQTPRRSHRQLASHTRHPTDAVSYRHPLDYLVMRSSRRSNAG